MQVSDITTTTDGRKLQSEDSKRRIVSAMLELVREGKIAPTAEDVAKRAQVGIRTVFRRFRDMESLYAEMAGAIDDRIASINDGFAKQGDWRANLNHMVERRLQVYEIVMPYRVAAEALKFQSTILLTQHMKFVREERQRLLALIPEKLLADAVLTEGLEAALSFDMWNQLRNDQRLNGDEAGEVVKRIVSSLLAAHALNP